jgi:nucleoside-triphosphatase
VIRKVAAGLAGRPLAGFYTEEIRRAGERRGFRLVTFDGRKAVMAHLGFKGPHRVGRYGVDVAVIDGLAESSLSPTRPVDCVLVDEVGKMECLSSRFVAALRALLDGPAQVVATIAQRGGGFIAEVKRRPGAECWELTASNREAMPGRVLEWLSRR